MTDGNKILAVLAEQAGAGAVLRHAARAAEALLGSRITALHVRVDPFSTIMPTEEILSDAQARAIELEGEREAVSLLAVFEGWRSHEARCQQADWTDVVGTVDEQVRRHSETAALLVAAAPRPEARGHVRQAFHVALFDTGRPVLAITAEHVARPVQRIVVGWKDNDVSRRAVREAAPWLRQANAVHAVHVGDAEDELATGEQLLADLGIRAATRAVSEEGLTDGARLLAEAERLGADWLVMGAYRRSRLAEWILGGVTRTVLGASNVPLFLVH